MVSSGLNRDEGESCLRLDKVVEIIVFYFVRSVLSVELETPVCASGWFMFSINCSNRHFVLHSFFCTFFSTFNRKNTKSKNGL